MTHHAAAKAVDSVADDVAAAAAGETAAFERLYRAEVARVASLARWLLGGDDVEDAVQEIFLRAWRKLGTFDGRSSFGTWLHRVAVNHLLRARQDRGRRRERETESELAIETASTRRERPELRIAIQRAVEQLPPRARDVFVLHDMEGYRHDEIADLLGVDAGTSRSQLHRARLTLRRILAT